MDSQVTDLVDWSKWNIVLKKGKFSLVSFKINGNFFHQIMYMLFFQDNKDGVPASQSYSYANFHYSLVNFVS